MEICFFGVFPEAFSRLDTADAGKHDRDPHILLCTNKNVSVRNGVPVLQHFSWVNMIFSISV